MTIFSKNQRKSEINRFLDSLSDLLKNITAIEINTIIVDEITEKRFIPWAAYRDIYSISRQSLQHAAIHESLRDRYLNLRRKLELEYSFLAIDPRSEFYNPALVAQIKQDLPILSNLTGKWDETQTRLPPPNTETIFAVEKLLNNYLFLRSLRKIWQLKTVLDRGKEALATEMISAQTIISFDGNITNHYDRKIFIDSQKEIILQIHKYGLKKSARQWRIVLDFFRNLVANYKYHQFN